MSRVDIDVVARRGRTGRLETGHPDMDIAFHQFCTDSNTNFMLKLLDTS